MNVHLAGTACSALVCFVCLCHPLIAQQPDPLALAQLIDERIAEQQRLHDVPAAPRSSDAEFVRRIHLDLIGRIPSAAQTREFLADTNPLKRQLLIDELLDSPQYLNYFTGVWSSWLVPQSGAENGLRYLSTEFHVWIRRQLADNVPYNELVRRLLTAQLPQNVQGVYSYYNSSPDGSPLAFFAASQNKAENAATSAARLFLGLRVDCAQCHDHPTADWKREQYWSFAAFFREVEPRSPFLFGLLSGRSKKKPPLIRIPNTEIRVAATFLDGSQPDFTSSPREHLADWIVSDSNPYFARAAVNRMWSHFFGRGLVEPVDDMGDQSGTHPELLQDLADGFRSSGYDLKFLMRAITSSETYQRSSRAADPRQLESQWYARFFPKKLSGDQLHQSVLEAAGAESFVRQYFNQFIQGSDPELDRLRELVDAGNERPIDKPTSLLESLTLMNGYFMQSATSEHLGRLVRAVGEMPGLSDEQRLTTIFLATLTREPTPGEQSRLLSRLQQAPDDQQRQAFFSDLMWALLNSSEFSLNH